MLLPQPCHAASGELNSLAEQATQQASQLPLQGEPPDGTQWDSSHNTTASCHKLVTCLGAIMDSQSALVRGSKPMVPTLHTPSATPATFSAIHIILGARVSISVPSNCAQTGEPQRNRVKQHSGGGCQNTGYAVVCSSTQCERQRVVRTCLDTHEGLYRLADCHEESDDAEYLDGGATHPQHQPSHQQHLKGRLGQRPRLLLQNVTLLVCCLCGDCLARNTQPQRNIMHKVTFFSPCVHTHLPQARRCCCACGFTLPCRCSVKPTGPSSVWRLSGRSVKDHDRGIVLLCVW